MKLRIKLLYISSFKENKLDMIIWNLYVLVKIYFKNNKLEFISDIMQNKEQNINFHDFNCDETNAHYIICTLFVQVLW